MSTTFGYSNQLELDRIFYHCRDQIYAICKLDNFPNYYRGNDIDVFCYNINQFVQTILSIGNYYVNQGFEIKVTHVSKSQIYIDFYYEGNLEFRFDLYGSLPEYKKICLKQYYLFSVIENASTLYREFNGEKYPIFVPSPVDDLLLRYVEYIEWYELRPDKIKHLNYIVDAIESEPSRIDFLDKLHLYTELPKLEFENNTNNYYTKFYRVPLFFNKLRSVPMLSLPRIAFRKITQSFNIRI